MTARRCGREIHAAGQKAPPSPSRIRATIFSVENLAGIYCIDPLGHAPAFFSTAGLFKSLIEG